MKKCPCGSNAAYDDCCRPIISGSRAAETAEQLMRARYAAYAEVETDFLFESTHPGHRKGYDHDGTREWAEKSEWLGLEIVETRLGGADEGTGEVEFVARFREKGALRAHHERARFERRDGRWYFTEGTMVNPRPITVDKIGRNDPCPCGSGLKHKKCCGK